MLTRQTLMQDVLNMPCYQDFTKTEMLLRDQFIEMCIDYEEKYKINLKEIILPEYFK